MGHGPGGKVPDPNGSDQNGFHGSGPAALGSSRFISKSSNTASNTLTQDAPMTSASHSSGHSPALIDADAVPGLLRPGMQVYVGGGACEPRVLVEALRVTSGAAGVTFIQSIVPGLTRTDFTSLHPEARITTFFMTPETQAAYDEGRVDFVPMQLRLISDYSWTIRSTSRSFKSRARTIRPCSAQA